jgi:hypothetical protein
MGELEVPLLDESFAMTALVRQASLLTTIDARNWFAPIQWFDRGLHSKDLPISCLSNQCLKSLMYLRQRHHPG